MCFFLMLKGVARMKKRVFAILLAVLVFGLTACAPQKDGGVTTTAQKAVTTTEAGMTTTTTATTTKVGVTVTAEKPATTTRTMPSPASLRCYSIGEERDVVLSADEKAYIVSAIQSLSWRTDHYKCASGYMFYYDGKELYYHESCGSVNDNINHKAAKFSDEQVKAIDAILGVGKTTTTRRRLPSIEDCDYDVVDGEVRILSPKEAMEGHLIIPSTVDGYTVTAIGENAFAGCSGLTKVDLPETLIAIEDGAFEGCSGLTAISIPYGVTDIGERAFAGCSGLEVLTVPDKITVIRKETFSGCVNARSVGIYNTVTTIEENAFAGCSALVKLHYVGKQSEWEAVTIHPNGNQALFDAEHFYKRK